jgi:hypothetical protein
VTLTARLIERDSVLPLAAAKDVQCFDISSQRWGSSSAASASTDLRIATYAAGNHQDVPTAKGETTAIVCTRQMTWGTALFVCCRSTFETMKAFVTVTK